MVNGFAQSKFASYSIGERRADEFDGDGRTCGGMLRALYLCFRGMIASVGCEIWDFPRIDQLVNMLADASLPRLANSSKLGSLRSALLEEHERIIFGLRECRVCGVAFP